MKHRLALLLLPVAALYGCAGPIETRIQSSGDESATVQEFMLIGLPENSSAAIVEARSLMSEALEKQNIRQKEDANILLSVTVSDRPADLALKVDDIEISPAKKKKLLQNCEDKEYRLTMQLTRISDGVQLYRGEAAEYHCNASLKETLPVLIDILIADMNDPGGIKRRLRFGKE